LTNIEVDNNEGDRLMDFVVVVVVFAGTAAAGKLNVHSPPLVSNPNLLVGLSIEPDQHGITLYQYDG
jgi:hypothetical protein